MSNQRRRCHNHLNGEIKRSIIEWGFYHADFPEG
jgi:hypothetical protein